MSLLDWMQTNRMTIADVARRLRVKPDTVSRWLKIGSPPTEQHCRAIWRMTNGQVRQPWPSPEDVAARSLI